MKIEPAFEPLPLRENYLGPATVLAVSGRTVQLETPDCFPEARLALASPYEPCAGDVVLAVGGGDRWYVIGVLEGSGATSISVPGDLRLLAPNGKVEIVAGTSLQLNSPLVTILAQKLDVAARSLLERFHEATRLVSEALHLRAGRVRTRVDGLCDLKAGEIKARAEGDLRLDGKTIHLS